MSQSRRRSALPVRKIAVAVAIVALLGAGWYFWGKQKNADAEGGYRKIEPAAGESRLGGRDVRALGHTDLRRARADMQMVFQDPFASLNP